MRRSKRAKNKFKKKERLSVFLKWFFYCLTLIFFYMLISGGFFKKWQPVLIVPLAIAVALREGELKASIFGAFCGLIMDIAGDKLFGFSGVWLIPSCLGAALLASHLIKANLLNFLWVNLIACFLSAITDHFFLYALWGVENSRFVMTEYILPAYLSAVILSPLVYFIVKSIFAKFSLEEIPRPTSSSSAIDEDEYD